MKKVKWLSHNEWLYFCNLYEKDFNQFKIEYENRKGIELNEKNLYYFRLKYNNIMSKNKNKNFNIEDLTDDEINNILEHYRKIIKQKNYNEDDEKITEEIIKKSKTSCRKLSSLLGFSKSKINRIKNNKNSFKNDKYSKRNEIIKEIFNNNYCSIGRKPLSVHYLNRTNIHISDRQIGRIMNKLCLFCNVRIKNKSKIKEIKNSNYYAPDLVLRDYDNKFHDEHIIATDITYINSPSKENQNHVFLSVFISHRNKEILGFHLSRKNDVSTVLKSLPKNIGNNAIIHSDHSVLYQSYEFKEAIKNYKQSMSRIGNSLDNRVVENFFGTLKCELINKLNLNKITFEELDKIIKNYIYYYNNFRIQEKLFWQSPTQYENNKKNYL